MLIDLVPYCGENDLLDIRLNSLKGIVDLTIILESEFSHTLISKPLFFAETKERFSKFNIQYIVKNFKYENPFHSDWAGRMALFDEIPNQIDSPIILHGDLDEIPNPDKLKEVIDNLTEPVVLESDYYFFCCDLWGRKDESNIIMKYDWIREPFYKYRDARHTNFFKKVENAGYHYSSVGTLEQIARKWEFFAHSSEVANKYKNPEYIKSQIKRKAGSWSEDAKNDELRLVEHIYPNLPNYLLQNREKFKHLFYDYYAGD